jgi:hypothetical protein
MLRKRLERNLRSRGAAKQIGAESAVFAQQKCAQNKKALVYARKTQVMRGTRKRLVHGLKPFPDLPQQG